VAAGESTDIGPCSLRRSVTDNDLMAITLASLAVFLVALWGVAHAIPTRQVLFGFEPITQDNRQVVLQEWLAEAFTMWGLAGIVVSVTIVGGSGSNWLQNWLQIWVFRFLRGLTTS